MTLFDLPDNKCYIWTLPSNQNPRVDEVQVVGYQCISPGEPYPKAGFPDICLFKDHGGRVINAFQLVYIAKGAGTLKDRGITHEVHTGQFLLIHPGLWHSYAPNKDIGWEEYYIGFNGPKLTRLTQEIYNLNKINLLSVKSTDFALPLFSAALKIGATQNAENNLLIKAILTELLLDIRFSLNNHDVSNESLMFKTREYMEKNLSRKIKNEDVARHLCVSTSWFRKEFFKEAGVPPATFLGRIRLQTSKYILLSGDKSIKEIAVECGFSSSEYFCKYFKDNTGMTPSEFRISHHVEGHNN